MGLSTCLVALLASFLVSGAFRFGQVLPSCRASLPVALPATGDITWAGLQQQTTDNLILCLLMVVSTCWRLLPLWLGGLAPQSLPVAAFCWCQLLLLQLGKDFQANYGSFLWLLAGGGYYWLAVTVQSLGLFSAYRR